MQNTKEKILETSIRLFNESGTDAITVRHIAKEMGISHGNLCYHFLNVGVIIENLYQKLVDELNVLLAELPMHEISLQNLYETIKLIYDKFYKFRFMMQDFIGIIRKVPSLKQRHKDLVAARFIFFQYAVAQIREKGLLKEERFPKEFESFFQHLFIISDFWMAEAEILFEGTETEKLHHYSRLTFNLMLPFLSEKGFEEYQNLKW